MCATPESSLGGVLKLIEKTLLSSLLPMYRTLAPLLICSNMEASDFSSSINVFSLTLNPE